MPRPPDSIDLEALEALTKSNAWRMVAERLRAMEQAEMRQLRRDIDPVETAKVRGKLDAIAAALEVPAILIREIRAKKP